MMTSFYNLLKYAKTGIASPEMTAYDKMRAVAMGGGGAIKTLTGVPPLSFRANGKPLISWSMLGNSQQNGTPAPDAPIYPEFVGERTGNLAPTIGEDSGWRVGYLTNQGTYTNNNPRGEILSPMISLSGIASFTISASNYSVPSMSVYYFNGATFISNQGATDYGGSVFDNFPSGATHFCFAIRTGYQTIDSVVNHGWRVMLNSGSTALPYEPYGYKIPITSAGQTVPIYLGQTQTVRRIKKLVLTGEENWTFWNGGTGVYYTADIQNYLKASGITCVCSHYPANDNVQGTSAAQYGVSFIYNNPAYRLYIVDTAISTIDALKSYLAVQYAAGTPVTVWYVLAEPETAIVNEPLAKIGTYADELHSIDAGVSIPTAKGANTLTVDTELQPSSMTITYCG